MSKLKEKGITLLALVVTVIILLILAGVTIAQITGNEGLFNKVRKAVSQYEDAQEKEEIGITNLVTMLGEERENNKQLEEPTASPADVLEEKSYYDKNKEPQTGKMTNNGAVNATIEPGGKPYTIPEGYHNGEGTVSFLDDQYIKIYEKGDINITQAPASTQEVTINLKNTYTSEQQARLLIVGYDNVVGVAWPTTAGNLWYPAAFPNVIGNQIKVNIYNGAGSERGTATYKIYYLILEYKKISTY